MTKFFDDAGQIIKWISPSGFVFCAVATIYAHIGNEILIDGKMVQEYDDPYVLVPVLIFWSFVLLLIFAKNRQEFYHIVLANIKFYVVVFIFLILYGIVNWLFFN